MSGAHSVQTCKAFSISDGSIAMWVVRADEVIE
jgi:hypothetical protein